jgi:hypothetical protein
LPNDFTPKGTPTSIIFTDHPFGELNVMTLAKSYQDAPMVNTKHPLQFSVS